MYRYIYAYLRISVQEDSAENRSATAQAGVLGR